MHHYFATRVQDLWKRTQTVKETGEPFGTEVIMEMAAAMLAKGEKVLLHAESVSSTIPPRYLMNEQQKALKIKAGGAVAPFLGESKLREAVAKRAKWFNGITVDPESEVLVTAGSMQAIYFAMQVLLNPGDEVIMVAPNFFFDIPVELASGTPVFIPISYENSFKHDAERFGEKITNKTKMIVICSPHNPTGRVLTENELRGIAKLAKEHDLLIMHDEVYDGFTFDGRKHISLLSFKDVRDRVISIHSFSKLYYMLNFRLGYAIANKEIIERMVLPLTYSSMGVPNFIQCGAAAALEEDWEKRHLKRTISKMQRYRDHVVKRFNEVQGLLCIKPEGTNLVLTSIEKLGLSSMEFAKYILKEGKVAVAPGNSYHAEGYFRFTLGLSEKTLEAADRIADAAAKLSRDVRK
jgi:aspartate/methionine/tyrosine aminotransferase